MGDVAFIKDYANRRPEPWVTFDDVAEHFGMSRRWVEQRVADGMPSEKFGRSRRFRISACEEWLLRRAG